MIQISRPMIDNLEISAVSEVLASGMIARGKVVEDFEEQFKTYINMPYACATSSGTTALMSALASLSLPPKTKIITTAFSFIATTSAIIYIDGIPIFADIDERTFNISPKSIEELLEKHPDTKALLIVHLFGQSCDMDRIMEIVKKYNLILIEDCAQAHGAMWHGQKLGSFGHASIFSFYPTKNMTTTEGGMCLFKDIEVYKKAKRHINHGCNQLYYHDEHGYNFQMSNIEAAIGIQQLKKLVHFNEQRIRNATYYNEKINNTCITKPYRDSRCHHVYNQYSILIDEECRQAFVKYLETNGIAAKIYYPLTIPEQRCFEIYGFDLDLPISNKIKKTILSIPVHPALLEAETSIIAEVINGYSIS